MKIRTGIMRLLYKASFMGSERMGGSFVGAKFHLSGSEGRFHLGGVKEAFAPFPS